LHGSRYHATYKNFRLQAADHAVDATPLM
jgi:hypothetical protein